MIPTVIGEYIEEIDPSQNVGGLDAQTEKKILYEYGNAAYLNKDKYTLSEPIQRGRIHGQDNWDNMCKIWEYIFN